MHDPLDNRSSHSRENAAASQDRGGLLGAKSASPATPHPVPVRPALHAAGAYVFLRLANMRAAHTGRPHLPPPAPPRPSGRAPHR